MKDAVKKIERSHDKDKIDSISLRDLRGAFNSGHQNFNLTLNSMKTLEAIRKGFNDEIIQAS